MNKLHGSFIECLRQGHYKLAGRIVICSDNQFITLDGVSPNLQKNYPVKCMVDTLNDSIQNHYLTEEVLFDDEDRSSFVRYFSGSRFKGISKIRAGNLYDALHQKKVSFQRDNFDNLPEKMLYSTMEEQNIKDDLSKMIVSDILALKYRRDILHELQDVNAIYSDAEALFDTYGNETVSRIKDNPYLLNCPRLSFHLIDALGKKQKKLIYDESRIRFIFKKAAAYVLSTGSTCITTAAFLNIIEKIERQGVFPSLPKELWLSFLLGSEEFKIRVFKDKTYIFVKDALVLEESIKRELLRLMNAKEDTGFTEYTGTAPLDEDQLNAISFLKDTGVKIITGGPGAGKTTIIKEFIGEYLKINKGGFYQLAAPTGRAAVRISETSGLSAKTIHKLLGIRPFQSNCGEIHADYNKEHQLPKGLYIIDEMSMVSENIFYQFLCAVPNGSLVLLSGDPRQLPSVDYGNVLKDLIDCDLIPVQRLTKIHRQKKGSSIIDNYYKIKNFETTLINDDFFTVMDFTDTNNMLRKLYELRDKYEVKDDPYSFQILSFTRKGISGIESINSKIAVEKRQASSVSYKTPFIPGDKIMMLHNNYPKKYYNGDIGIVTYVEENKMEAKFYDGIRTIDKEDYKDVDFSWACTVHKSQGSQYDTVVVIASHEAPNMLANALILTAITRAIKKVIVLNENNAFYEAIQNNTLIETRKTGLSLVLGAKNDTGTV